MSIQCFKIPLPSFLITSYPLYLLKLCFRVLIILKLCFLDLDCFEHISFTLLLFCYYFKDHLVQNQVQLDPFNDHENKQSLIGVANVFLSCLLQDAPLRYPLPIIDQQGQVLINDLHSLFFHFDIENERY